MRTANEMMSSGGKRGLPKKVCNLIKRPTRRASQNTSSYQADMDVINNAIAMTYEGSGALTGRQLDAMNAAMAVRMSDG